MARKSSYTVSGVPLNRFSRSQFDLSHGHKTSASMGYLYPLDPIEVLPGDTFKGEFNLVARLSSSFVKPIMDNIFIDVYHFFVPSRILYVNFVNIFGENTESAWANTQEYEVPFVSSSMNNFLEPNQAGSSAQVGCHFGLPIDMDLDSMEGGINLSVLPFRAFAMVYNDFFRDQNSIPPMNITKGETTDNEGFNTNPWSPSNYTGLVPKVAKLHDYFTSALPSPQKGDAVDIPLSLVSPIPVVARPEEHTTIYDGTPLKIITQTNAYSNGVIATDGAGANRSLQIKQNSNTSGDGYDFGITNMYAEPGSYLTDLTVNELRLAFQTQKMLERDARCGTRYVEYLLGHWGVTSGDSRLQRPEFLGGRRIPINVQQIAQTTGFSTSSAPNTLAQLGAYSLSGGRSKFTKSFVEHGYIISCFCIRQFHSYQQGIPKLWQRKKRLDFYEPVFANIGEQPIYQNQLFTSQTTNAIGANGSRPIFGYQEAWAEYRQLPNIISGQMNSNSNDSLDIWHLGDIYASAPILGEQFINETDANLNRVITVNSSSQDQFILDFWEDLKAVRNMPTYSVPSLIDHN
ncbi:major capsid protein [Microvirus mar10]|uniref:Major capsid protein n=1 Tax=Microvirus mar10 TaxID=2851142 RepID=A0A8F5MIR1_9VIRU|nr:major capsid protein [Microvirus mar10]